MKFPLKLLLVISLMLFNLQFIGCATVTRGTDEALEINTDPAGAKVTIMQLQKIKYDMQAEEDLQFENREEEYVQGGYLYIVDPEFQKLTGTTPTSFKLSRRHQYKVIVEKEGYESARVTVNTQVTDAGSAGLAGNLCLGGCIGASVDVASGAMNKFVPNPIDIHLVASKEIEQRKYLTYEAEKFGIPAIGSFHDAYAVVVGISKYKYSGQGGLTNLIYADDDAREMARMLKMLGWPDSRIKLLINEQATKRDIEIALEAWLSKAGKDDLIVLFWSGHGFPDPEVPERVYFACYDTNTYIPPTGYRMDKVRIALEEREARNVVVFADTCHAGKLITRGGEKGISIVPHIEKMRRERNIPAGWIFMVGADSDRLAVENSSWTNGAFTRCLVEALSGKADGFESVGPNDGTVTMRELRAYLNTTMPDQTQKVLGVAKRPVITTSTGDPNIWNLSLGRRPAEKYNQLKSTPARFEIERQPLEKEEHLGKAERQGLDNEKQQLAYVQKTDLAPEVSLRSDPKLVLEMYIRKSLKAHNFYDRDLNKHGSFVNNFVDSGGGTIPDRATGLMWEKGGSPTPRSLKRARSYVKKLNKDKFAGYSDWRLPTIEELASLLESQKTNGRHIDPLFDQKQARCWSSDEGPKFGGESFTPPQAWYVNFLEGKIGLQVVSPSGGESGKYPSFIYVRAVRSLR